MVSNIKKWASKSGVHILLSICMLWALFVPLTGCGGGTSSKPNEGAPYETPPLLLAEWQGVDVKKSGTTAIDFSNVNKGYVAVTYAGEKKAKVQILLAETNEVYNYDIRNDGTIEYYPLQMGDGTYSVRVLTQVEGNSYTEILKGSATVTLESEFAPFLVPSMFVNYDMSTECVQLFYDITKDCETDVDVVAAVYDYIKENISYDREKAEIESNRTGYVPDLNQVLRDQTGICFDYAALAAAMLRAGGIPTRMIFGYVSQGELYHAWNMIYLEGQGWITVRIYIDKETWSLIDLTFAAGAGDAELVQYIGEGDNYAQVYVY